MEQRVSVINPGSGGRRARPGLQRERLGWDAPSFTEANGSHWSSNASTSHAPDGEADGRPALTRLRRGHRLISAPPVSLAFALGAAGSHLAMPDRAPARHDDDLWTDRAMA